MSPKFSSLIHPQKYVCEGCVLKEDLLWFSSKNITEYPDFTNEVQDHLKVIDKRMEK